MTQTIDYPGMIDVAMRGVVRETLRQVQRSGLPGEHHLFISFRTGYPGVKISDALKARYPEEMTIVIQHQFWDLQVTEQGFSVMLSFNNIPEKLVIPFDALVAFADPSIKFGLQFHGRALPEESKDGGVQDNLAKTIKNLSPKKQPGKTASDNEEPASGGAEVITLDAFRKK